MSQNGAPESIDLLSLVGDLKNGENTGYKTKLFGDPSDFEIETVAGYRAEYTYEGRAVHVNPMKGDRKVMTFSVRFKVTNMQPKGPCQAPLTAARCRSALPVRKWVQATSCRGVIAKPTATA